MDIMTVARYTETGPIPILQECETALNDWIHVYASDFSDPESTEAAYERIKAHGGTEAYIARHIDRLQMIVKYERGLDVDTIGRLFTVMSAFVDWRNTCPENSHLDVAREYSTNRLIQKGGTLAYIADILEALSDLYKTLNQIRGTGIEH